MAFDLEKIQAELHGDRRAELEALWMKRDEPITALATMRAKIDKELITYQAIEAEIRELLGFPAEITQSPRSRAPQKCKFVLADGTVCGSEEHNSRFHNEK